MEASLVVLHQEFGSAIQELRSENQQLQADCQSLRAECQSLHTALNSSRSQSRPKPSLPDLERIPGSLYC
ncbi:hypothetical protein PAAG_11403 [Paracoccidioides lutzii Pb01]|uniref:Uncharacterized protein n=1 Tax=Paracoccidioides lutzii (strain ATCC MYA-826 / Pb01) TaxID=502779 RepID=A0A0A2V2W0_PARBA|nr:hypothetical protein PAAG_11403 [Paracoccidioides lutzii Pb01]KGQ01828.1 hypothetical protein PAAG_11403 [Paracoccidioides lutzii Pb01]